MNSNTRVLDPPGSLSLSLRHPLPIHTAVMYDVEIPQYDAGKIPRHLVNAVEKQRWDVVSYCCGGTYHMHTWYSRMNARAECVQQQVYSWYEYPFLDDRCILSQLLYSIQQYTNQYREDLLLSIRHNVGSHANVTSRTRLYKHDIIHTSYIPLPEPPARPPRPPASPAPP